MLVSRLSRGAEGTQRYQDYNYDGLVVNGSFNSDNVILDPRYVLMKTNGYDDYMILIEVRPKNVATANIAVDLGPMSSDTNTLMTTEIHKSATIQPAPMKSQTRVALQIIAQLETGVVLHR